ncbi:hypothetical protein [Roseibium sp. MMSF_3544]|uniref:hypothetical protein n=1 Tax=unclassified Roseibium TaxID=2629323 RepID=UPI00273DB81B|nr:hypothetical protein [Roseibium sp. MMSF_3544]
MSAHEFKSENKTISGREFQFWHFNVSHGSLLVRSPKSSAFKSNVDLIFAGVEFVSLPRYLNEITMDWASFEELELIGNQLASQLEPSSKAYVIQDQFARHLIVAVGFKLETNERDFIDTGFG